ncbi:uncharacterized protein [Phaseolus vulgaris]|uniref:uncharacterized protein n=1 Tax=Phaseolus vulgaris TaxID=3885 RepID=UPI0035CA0221
MTLILKMQKEMEALKKENARMKEKLAEKPEIPEAVDNILSRDHANADTHEVGSSYQENVRPTSHNVLGTTPRRSPFAEIVLEVPLSGTWSNPTLDKYDGTTDPDEHVNAYLTQVGLHTAEDALWCRIFPTSLKGATLTWFTRLPAQSIDCFDTLATKFGAQFTTSRPHHLTSIALVNIRQEKSESLRAFMDKFNKMVLDIRNLSPEVAMQHMVTALKPGPFFDSLCMQLTTTMDELRQRATKYMQLEELKEFLNKARAPDEPERTGSSQDMERQSFENVF